MGVRAVFLVHGVGSQKKGQFLESVLEPLQRFLRLEFRDELRAAIDQRPPDGPAHATIEFLDERWEITEVWWAEAFYAQPAQRILKWGFVALFRNLGNFAVGTVPFLRRLFGQRPAPPCQDSVYTGVVLGTRSRLYDLIVGPAAAVVFLLAALPLLLLATAFYLLALLPKWLIFPSWLRSVVVGLVSYLVEGFGDQYALMYSETAAASARQVLVEALRPYMDTQGPGRMNCDSVSVIAHSGGATVCLQALSDPKLWREWTGTSEPPMGRDPVHSRKLAERLQRERPQAPDVGQPPARQHQVGGHVGAI